MSGSNRRQTQSVVTLFPFLAVLICTMGALIMLLVLVMEQARSSVPQQSSPASTQEPDIKEQLRVQKEDQLWRGQVLQQQRQELRSELTQRRDYLAYVEQQIRQLENQLELLQKQAGELRRTADESVDSDQRLIARQEELERAVVEARAALEEARRQSAQRRPSFAIVPYVGPNGTLRRPIYVECTADAVIFRPENVVLRSEDFQGPLGPGNPFDAALRAAATYLDAHTDTGNGQPYPLLIVRPDGILAYAAARQAMTSWEDEFGYELVSGDLLLHYPPADPQLAQLLEKAVKEARLRQAALRRAMPSQARSGGFVVSSTRGGVIPLDATPLGDVRRGTGQRRTSSTAPQSGSTATDNVQSETSPQSSSAATPSGSRSGAPGGTQSFGSLRPLAATRGSHWAIDKRSTGATAYRRPLRVVCQNEALILMPEAGSDEAPLVFSLTADPVAAIDQFVVALRKRVETWGLPPLGGYWQPRLIADVAPDAEARYQLLVTLLQDSGLELERNIP